MVLRAGPGVRFGNAIYIQDADGNVHIYGHMRYYTVHAGQIVHAGDQIAKVGDQGQSTGPHLHYEIRHGSMEGRATIRSRGSPSTASTSEQSLCRPPDDIAANFRPPTR